MCILYIFRKYAYVYIDICLYKIYRYIYIYTYQYMYMGTPSHGSPYLYECMPVHHYIRPDSVIHYICQGS